MSGVGEIWKLLPQDAGTAAVPFILGALGFLAYAAGRIVWGKLRRIWCSFTSRRRALGAVGRQHPKDGVREGRGLWLSLPIAPPATYGDNIGTPPVLVIASQKGEVGKTTLTANVGAFWSREWNKRVLLIDLDAQGSLSAMALRAANWLPPKGQDSVATRMISGDLEPSIFLMCAKDVPTEQRLKVIPAYYDLAQADSRLIVEWLLQCKSGLAKAVKRRRNGAPVRDLRYHLAELLHSNAVRQEFDVIIIDCPPQLTTGTIQALCAGSHLLIPTTLDQVSSGAVIAFVDEVEALKKGNVCPHLKYVGIVGTKVGANADRVTEKAAKASIINALRENDIEAGLIADAESIPYSPALASNSDDGIAYLAVGNSQSQLEVRRSIGKLADFISRQIGLAPPQPHEDSEVQTSLDLAMRPQQ
jgi:chromosome partitioning protein